jgi:hypothetical protein
MIMPILIILLAAIGACYMIQKQYKEIKKTQQVLNILYEVEAELLVREASLSDSDRWLEAEKINAIWEKVNAAILIIERDHNWEIGEILTEK